VYFTTLFQVLNLSPHKLKYLCNAKDIECLKCIICIECFILQHVSHSPDYKSEVNNSQPDEQSLCNISQHIDNDPNDNQQVQSRVNKSDYWLEQVHTSPDEPRHSFPWKYHSTPKKSGTSCSKRSCVMMEILMQLSTTVLMAGAYVTDLSYIADVTDQLSVGETHDKVCQRNSLPARDGQPSADGNMCGHKTDTAHLENLASEVRYRRSQSDGRHECTERHDCTHMLPPTHKHHDFHSCHSPANSHLHEM
jgi:hypothetical protein